MSSNMEPQKVVEQFSRNYRIGRYDIVYDLYSVDSEFRKNFTKETFSSRMRSTAQRTKMEIKESKIVGSEVRGENARIVLLSTTKSIVGEWHVEEEFTLRKEPGGWKILSMSKARQWPLKQGGTSTRGMM